MRFRKVAFIILILLVFNFISMTSVSALGIVVHVPEKYLEVQAGERFYFEIEIKYPENPSREDLTLQYEILKDDKVIAQSKVLKAVETQASFIDFIVLPANSESGFNIMNVQIFDEEGVFMSEVSASFQIIGSGFNQIKIYFFVLLGAIVLVGILIVVIILTKGRK